MRRWNRKPAIASLVAREKRDAFEHRRLVNFLQAMRNDPQFRRLTREEFNRVAHDAFPTWRVVWPEEGDAFTLEEAESFDDEPRIIT